jgi:hypothetical protein
MCAKRGVTADFRLTSGQNCVDLGLTFELFGLVVWVSSSGAIAC